MPPPLSDSMTFFGYHLSRSLAVLALALPLPAWAQVGFKTPASFEEAVAQYEEYGKLEPFYLHAVTWARLAQSEDPRGLAILIETFAEEREPLQTRRHALMSITTRHFNDDAAVEPLAALRATYDEPSDAWIWFRTLRVDAANRGPAACLELIGNSKLPVALRAAAMEALGWCESADGVYEGVRVVLGDLPRKPEQVALFVGAIGTALERHVARRTAPEFEAACKELAKLLDHKNGIGHSTKLVIARHLAKIFDSETLHLESGPWIALLEGGAGPAEDRSKKARTPPTFFGAKASGNRICYLIDLSDSMGKSIEISDEIKQGMSHVAWAKIETRFDLQREELKRSLRSLTSDDLFCVVWYGDDSDLLHSCKGMVKASKGVVKKVIKELDNIQFRPGRGSGPKGRLRGRSNLFGGLRKSFRVKKKGFVDEHSYVTAESFEEGANTLFVLLDGDQNWDDFPKNGPDKGETQWGDPESGAEIEAGPVVAYGGPYSSAQLLSEEVERWNLFREVEVHCIVLGEDTTPPTDELVKRMTEQGHGTVVRLGR